MSANRFRALAFTLVLTALLASCLSTSSGAAPVAALPRLTGIIVPSWEQDGYSRPELSETLDQLVGLGIRRVSFIVTWYQNGFADSTFAPTEATPTDDALRIAVQAAHARGLSVVLKPHIDLPGDTWRGDIQPQNRDEWFHQYGLFIDKYADLAKELQVSTFVVGTELAGVSNDKRWQKVVSDVRSRYAGTLTYAANWDEADRVGFWSQLDEIGIDAYYPLSQSKQGTTRVSELVRAWKGPKQDLKKLASRFGKPVRFTEVGYTRHRGTTAAPWDFRLTTRSAPDEQAAAYIAVFRAWQTEKWFSGADFWSADPPGETADPLGYSPFDGPAEQALRDGAARMVN